MSSSSKNIFAALDTKKKKKSSKSSKEPSDKKKKRDEKPEKPQSVQQQHLFAANDLQDLQASNWADTDEEDDFDIQIQPLPASWVRLHAYPFTPKSTFTVKILRFMRIGWDLWGVARRLVEGEKKEASPLTKLEIAAQQTLPRRIIWDLKKCYP